METISTIQCSYQPHVFFEHVKWTEELNFKVCLILINLNNHMWLVLNSVSFQSFEIDGEDRHDLMQTIVNHSQTEY